MTRCGYCYEPIVRDDDRVWRVTTDQSKQPLYECNGMSYIPFIGTVFHTPEEEA